MISAKLTNEQRRLLGSEILQRLKTLPTLTIQHKKLGEDDGEPLVLVNIERVFERVLKILREHSR